MGSRKIFFIGKDDGLTYEELIKRENPQYPQFWKYLLFLKFTNEATIWWDSLDKQKMVSLPHEEFEIFFWKNGLMREERIMRHVRGHFLLVSSYYRFMDTF